jgi:hypothetical protein
VIDVFHEHTPDFVTGSDGTRVLRHDRFDALCARRHVTPTDLNAIGM